MRVGDIIPELLGWERAKEDWRDLGLNPGGTAAVFIFPGAPFRGRIVGDMKKEGAPFCEGVGRIGAKFKLVPLGVPGAGAILGKERLFTGSSENVIDDPAIVLGVL